MRTRADVLFTFPLLGAGNGRDTGIGVRIRPRVRVCWDAVGRGVDLVADANPVPLALDVTEVSCTIYKIFAMGLTVQIESGLRSRASSARLGPEAGLVLRQCAFCL